LIKKYRNAKLQGYLQSSVGAQAHCFASTVDENGNQIYHLSVILMFLVQTTYSRFSQQGVSRQSIKHTLINCEATGGGY
jgi:hypothetical protein